MKKKLKIYLVSVRYEEDDEFEIEAYSKTEARKKAKEEILGPISDMTIELLEE